jgi:sugar/nucleoside kinase (ribokinase family)
MDTLFALDQFPQSGVKVLPKQAFQIASGMATSAAVTIARLGAAVELWARIGQDLTGQDFTAQLQREGVDTTYVKAFPHVKTPFSSVLIDAQGERIAIPFFDPEIPTGTDWLPLERIRKAKAVLVDVRWVAGAAAALQSAKAFGVHGVLDADTAPLADLQALVPLASHVLFSEPALAQYCPHASPEQALHTLIQTLDAHTIGVTLGERGALIICNDSRTISHFPSPKIQAVDTLNAGDVWHGAFVWGLAQGYCLANIVPLANMAAAMKCEVFGGRRGAPTLAALNHRMQSTTQTD